MRSVTALLLASLLLPFSGSAISHESNGVNYHNWVNQRGDGCCNNEDCSALGEKEFRTNNGKWEISVVTPGTAGTHITWCPIQNWHYLRTGNAPDASVAHGCVLKVQRGTDPCDRVLCFQPPALY